MKTGLSRALLVYVVIYGPCWNTILTSKSDREIVDVADAWHRSLVVRQVFKVGDVTYVEKDYDYSIV